MAQDCFMIGAVGNELNKCLENAKVDKVYMPTREQIVLTLRTLNGNVRLLIEAGSTGRVHLTEGKTENPDTPPMFCMLLRKHLGGGRIIRVEQPGFERMLKITFLATDELGDLGEKSLVVEMMGRRNNIIFIDSERRILGCLKRVDLEMSPERPILPGLLYELPPKQNKVPLIGTTEQSFEQALAGQEITAKGLTDSILSLSPALAREVVYKSLRGDATVPQLLERLAKTAERGDYTPYLLCRNGIPFDYSSIKMEQYEDGECVACESFSKLLDGFYRDTAQAARRKNAASQLLKIVQNAYDRQVRKLTSQESELLVAQNREELKERADLIMANLHMFQGGETKVSVVNYFDPDLKEVELVLDPTTTPQKEAQRLYKNYGRMKNAEQVLTRQLIDGKGELVYIESLVAAATNAQDSRDIAALGEELAASGLVKAKVKHKKQLKNKKTTISPRKYVTDDGYSIFCGRNNIENDVLTMKQADYRDLWFHARNLPGSHVILACGGQEPSQQAIAQAAAVAAYFSKAANQPLAGVDYTMVKNVKKIPGAKPGMVTYSNFQTAFVKPEVMGEQK